MKIRELTKEAGQTTVPAWPPTWAGSYGAGDKLAVGAVGILKGVARRGDYVSLQMKYDERDHSGTLSWTAPPSLENVEKVLRANIGRELREIGEAEVV